MTTTNDRRCEVNEQEVKEQAESVFAGESCPTPMEWETTRRVLISRIRYALLAAYDEGVKAATPPKGHVLDDTGTVRRVLRTLPLTADGCVAIPMVDVVYHPCHPERTLDVDVENSEVFGQLSTPRTDGALDWRSYPIGECYSTSEAAESARQEEPQQ